MELKLLVVIVDEDKSSTVIDAAREAGATGATIINNVRGHGSTSRKTFLGLNLEGRRDVMLFLVSAERAAGIMEAVCAAGEFEDEAGTGIAIQLDVEAAVGLRHQLAEMLDNPAEGGDA